MSRFVVFLVLLGLSACGTALYVADYSVSRTISAPAAGISNADIADLRSGRIDLVAARYEAAGTTRITPQQLGLYCDILLKFGDFGRASACLDRLEARGGESSALRGKRALTALALGDPQEAARLVEGRNEASFRYVRALASVRLGQKQEARKSADYFAKQFDPKQVYYAANLYSAVGDDAASLAVLEDPARRLLRDYGVTPNRTAFGAAEVAPFRLDIFDEFGLGLLGNVSYSPAANVYVEYLAAHCLLQLGRVQEAVARLDLLLSQASLPAYKDVEWLVLYDRGRAARRLNQSEQARTWLEASVADIESMRKSVQSDNGRIGFAARKQDVYAELVDLLGQSGDIESALGYAERARSRAFVDLLASRDTLLPREISRQESTSLLSELDRTEGRELLASSAPNPSDALRGTRAAETRRRIEQRAPSLAPIISVSAVSLSQMRSTLSRDETAIAYFKSGSNWVAFVVTPTNVRLVPLPPFENATVVAFLRDVVTSRDGPPSGYMARGQTLYNSLVRPIEPLLTGRRIVFVPYGILHYVPFAALHDGHNHLIERYAIRQVPSLSASVIAQEGRNFGSGSLIIGNPDLAGVAPPLPATEREAVRVGEMLPQSTVLLGRQATLSQFLTLAPGKAYLHVASHGQFNSQTPLRSKLLLAADRGESGDLTVEKLYDMRLSARLVTLSACETAVSLVSDGDDLIGLVRGFLFAGSQNVVATLWEVSDATTGELIEDFYKGLPASHSIPDALREAQLAMMRRHPEPFHWAAFTPMSFTPQL